MTPRVSLVFVSVSIAALISGCGQPTASRGGGGGGNPGDAGAGAGAPGDVGPGSDPRDRDIGGGDETGSPADPGQGADDPGLDDGEGKADDQVGGTDLTHGAACTDSVQCLGGTCLNLPGGYCTQLGCAVDMECGDGAICVEVDASGLRGCLAACDGQTPCRDGYGCSPDGTCLPGFDNPGDGGDVDPGGLPGDPPGGGGDVAPGDGGGGDVDGAAVGSACVVDAECAGPAENSSCLTADQGFPGGYCTLFDCRPGSCPAGSGCFQVTDDGLTACLDECAQGCRDGYECRGGRACMPMVDDGGDPRDDPGPGDNPDPDPIDDPGPGPAPGDGGIGQGCGDDGDCDMPGARCMTDEDGFPGGYCLFIGCEDGVCPAGSDCFQVAEDGTTACLATCDEGCRNGYECVQGLACMPLPQDDPGPGPGDDPAADGSAIGGGCGGDGDCLDQGAVCLTPAQGFDGGYCSILNCGQAGCPAGSDCFQVAEDGTTACLDTCGQGCRQGYECVQDLACMPAGDGGGGAPPECEADRDCGGAEECINGRCIVPVGDVPDGPGPNCVAGRGQVTDWRCDGGERVCGEVLNFTPDEGPGWWDYPLNGETNNDQYRSWIRRDVMQLVKYASSMVECQSSDWDFGNYEPLGLGDMSERNGAIPGTRDGQPGHPAGTHVNGHDMDIAYYQVGTPDNILRAVCQHTSGGRDQYHCTAEPHLFDPWRTALFIAHLHESPQLRVVGVDGRIGVAVEAAVQQLCAEGYISANNPACRGRLALAFETVDEGRGWFRFHHHHLHISLLGQGQLLSVENPETLMGPNACITLDCSRPQWAVDASLELP